MKFRISLSLKFHSSRKWGYIQHNRLLIQQFIIWILKIKLLLLFLLCLNLVIRLNKMLDLLLKLLIILHFYVLAVGVFALNGTEGNFLLVVCVIAEWNLLFWNLVLMEGEFVAALLKRFLSFLFCISLTREFWSFWKLFILVLEVFDTLLDIRNRLRRRVSVERYIFLILLWGGVKMLSCTK